MELEEQPKGLEQMPFSCKNVIRGCTTLAQP